MKFVGGSELLCPHRKESSKDCEICHKHWEETGVSPILHTNEERWRPWLLSTIVKHVEPI